MGQVRRLVDKVISKFLSIVYHPGWLFTGLTLGPFTCRLIQQHLSAATANGTISRIYSPNWSVLEVTTAALLGLPLSETGSSR